MICAYDADGDGAVTFDEMMEAEHAIYGDELPYPEADYRELFNGVDLDGDGAVTEAEV